MTNLRSYIDAEQTPDTTSPAQFKTGMNQYEVSCASCGTRFFVSESMYLFAKEGIEVGLENPFKCDDCEEAYDQLIY